MATRRFDVSDRQRLIEEVANLLNRYLYYPDPPFPIDDTQRDWIMQFAPPVVREVHDMLTAANEKGIVENMRARYPVLSVFKSDVLEAALTFTNKLMYQTTYVLNAESHPQMYDEMVAWIVDFDKKRDVVNELQNFVADVAQTCTSAGQFARALPFMTQYMSPDLRASLSGAQRLSRMPKHIEAMRAGDPAGLRTKLHELESTAAVCSLLPPLTYARTSMFPSVLVHKSVKEKSPGV